VIAMETRDAPPAHFLIKIESFSLMQKNGIDKYETHEFVAGEYKWKLIIYLNEKDCDYISVHLSMSDSNSLPPNWEVNAVFNMFLLNQISGNYHYSVRTRRFHGMKMEWGFSKFISKKILLDPSNGYLMNDNCVFGAEVFVLKREAITENLSLESCIAPYKRDWKIANFSKLGHEWKSKEFSVGGHKWIRRISWPTRFCVFGLYWLRDLYAFQKKTHWFSGSINDWGTFSFVDLATINDPKKGFIVNDCCLLDIKMTVKGVAQVSPQ
ncbi:hypothetical protein MIMGU_mgv1a020363mg, partial [Erythranthe guttata]